MIDFYFWTTPNGYKVLMFLQETGIPYRIMPVNISNGEQYSYSASPHNVLEGLSWRTLER